MTLENKKLVGDEFYFYSGMLIAWGIAIVVGSTNKIDQSDWYALGVFGGGFLISIGLLPFPLRKQR